MNLEAYRTTWQRRYAGDLGGGPAFLTALVMAELADPASGAVTVGITTLAEITGLGRTTVHRAIKRAALYQKVDSGGGHRPARYVLASRWGTAGPVDNGPSVPLGDRSSVPPPPSSVPPAFQIHGLAVPQGDAQLKPKTFKPRFSVPPSDASPPAEVPDRVAELRRRMNGRGP